MNAFRRGHAITGLEDLSLVICFYLCLVASLPDNQACAHWQDELDGHTKTLRRWNKGKGWRQNYSLLIIEEAFDAILTDDDRLELIAAAFESKGFDPEKIDIKATRVKAVEFAINVVKE